MADRRLLLAIDTSTEAAGVAIFGDSACVSLSWNAGRNQTTGVLDEIDRCLTLAGAGPSDLTAVAIATGPGMFNGLRVGMSLAKGFAFGLDLPIIGISTLRVAADPWLGLRRDVVAVVAAGRGRVVWQRFSAIGVPVEDLPINTTEQELIQDLLRHPDSLVAGELSSDAQAVLAEHGTWLRTGAQGRRDPLALARLAGERLETGAVDDLVTIEPHYVHGRRSAVAD